MLGWGEEGRRECGRSRAKGCSERRSFLWPVYRLLGFNTHASLFPSLPRTSGPRSHKPPGYLAGTSQAASSRARTRKFRPRGQAPRGNTDSANHRLNREGRTRRRSRQRLHCQPMRSGDRVGVFAHWAVPTPPLGLCQPSPAT